MIRFIILFIEITIIGCFIYPIIVMIPMEIKEKKRINKIKSYFDNLDDIDDIPQESKNRIIYINVAGKQYKNFYLPFHCLSFDITIVNIPEDEKVIIRNILNIPKEEKIICHYNKRSKLFPLFDEMKIIGYKRVYCNRDGYQYALVKGGNPRKVEILN